MGYFQLPEMTPPLGWFGSGAYWPSARSMAGAFLGGFGQPSPDEIKNDQQLVRSLLPLCSDKMMSQLKQLVPQFEGCLTDIMFWRRHPNLRGTRLPRRASATTSQKPLLKEWENIRREVVRPVIDNYVSELIFDLKRSREQTCSFLKLTDLTNSLLFLQNPLMKKPDGTVEKAPSDIIDQSRRFVQREARDLSLIAEAYGELGCPAGRLKEIKQEAERLPWPTDQFMQAARNQLLGALQRGLERLGAK